MMGNRNIIATLVSVALLGASFATQAAISQAEADRLGKDLTPSGAIKAGNVDGSIPEWTGGLTKPPAGWNRQQGYTDPFPNEKAKMVITGANADQYKDKLTPGMYALLKKYDNFKMPVFATHRTAALPQEQYDIIKKEATVVEENGVSLLKREKTTLPFPIPKTGEEAMQNHLVRYFGNGLERTFAFFPVRANGETFKVLYRETVVGPQNFDPVQTSDMWLGYFGELLTPATLSGTVFLVHEFIDPVKNPRAAWIYNAGQRRVRRAPDLAYDNISDGTEGMRTTDQYLSFNGALDRYDWKLVGKKEMYVAYNTYRISDKSLKYKQIIQKNTINADLMRYELHRVWQVEATLKSGQKHIYGKRVFFLDEDSGMVLAEDAYDNRGQLWRVGVHGFTQIYDALVPFHSVEVWHDLSNGNYLVTHLDNEESTPMKFGYKAKWRDFQPNALRRRGQ